MTKTLDRIKLEQAAVINDGYSIAEVAGQVINVTGWVS
jgi:hypothetical protein